MLESIRRLVQMEIREPQRGKDGTSILGWDETVACWPSRRCVIFHWNAAEGYARHFTTRYAHTVVARDVERRCPCTTFFQGV